MNTEGNIELPGKVVTQVRRKLRAMREARGYTMEQMAEMLDITRQYYGMIEAGKRTPALPLAQKMSAIFGVDVNDLFSGPEGNDELQSANDVADA